MRIVITGPTGAIGMALIKLCIERNIDVLAICRRGSVGIERIPGNKLVQILELNLDEYASTEFEETYDVFYHLAWSDTTGKGRNDVYAHNKNVTHTLEAVDLARRLGCHTFIGAGSQAEYGRVEGKLFADTPTFPESAYGMAKLCAGQLSRIRCAQLGIKHVWTRILSVYGPYDDEGTLVTGTLIKLLREENVAFTAGEQVWDFLYSGDAAEILYRLIDGGRAGEIYCLGSGRPRRLQTFIEDIARAVAPEREMKFGDMPYAANQVMYLAADISKLESDLGDLHFTSFQEGIQQTLKEVEQRLYDQRGDRA